jgi:hypothetical protein
VHVNPWLKERQDARLAAVNDRGENFRDRLAGNPAGQTDLMMPEHWLAELTPGNRDEVERLFRIMDEGAG